jgi:hypothetical protein
MRKWDVWHLIWVLVLVVGLVLLGVTSVVAISYRDSSAFVNFASIWGLFVSLIGFLLTIYTLFDTQRITREAQQKVEAVTIDAREKIEAAAKRAQDAQERTRQLLERVTSGVRSADNQTLLTWMKGLRQATMQREWPKALLLAEESTAVGERLVRAEGLTDSERLSLRGKIDDLRLLHTFIRTNRLPAGPTQQLDLEDAKAKGIDDLIGLLEALSGRLFHEPTKGSHP